MKVDATILTVLMFIGAGAGAGYVIKTNATPTQSAEVAVATATDGEGSARVAPAPPSEQPLEGDTETPAVPHAWPPEIGEMYPDIDLIDLDGNPVRLSDYRGRILLIEPMAMGCKACQSFSGAKELGPFAPDDGGSCQKDLVSLEAYARRFAGVSFDDPRVLYVQVLLYDMHSKHPPTAAQARLWAEHFNLQRPNTLVTIASTRYVSQQTREMIPSFHLVDRDGVLKSDAGKPPRQNLYRELLPTMKKLLAESSEAD